MNSLTLLNLNKTPILIDINDESIKNHFNTPLNYGTHIINQINNGGCDPLIPLIPKNATCIDIGANIGLISLWMAEKCNKIYALEPNKSNYEILKKITLGYDNIDCLKIALNVEDKPVNFYECDFNSTMNSLIDFSNKNNYEEVRGIRLDSFIKEIQEDIIDFVKIDIEGSEIISLNEEILSNCKGKIKSYYLEIHDTFEINNRDQYGNLEIFNSIFKNLGYTAEQITYQVDNVTMLYY
jgi:FkbM family methyltransferase